MKFLATIAILTTSIATAIPTLLEHRDDAAGGSSELKALPYGMKSEPDCPKYKYWCLHCDVKWVQSLFFSFSFFCNVEWSAEAVLRKIEQNPC